MVATILIILISDIVIPVSYITRIARKQWSGQAEKRGLKTAGKQGRKT